MKYSVLDGWQKFNFIKILAFHEYDKKIIFIYI